MVAESFSIFPINSGVSAGQPYSLGRYPEDTYMGGNPWFLTTSAAAEQLYDAVAQWKHAGSITIDSVSLAFFADIYPSAAMGTFGSNTSAFAAITAAATTLADGYLAIVQKHTAADGSLNEQFDKSSGYEISAIDLTWSYAALLTANAARNGAFPASWGASGITSAC